MPCHLSEGAIEGIAAGSDVGKPVLQILGFKKIASNSADRYRIMISDGKFSHNFAMLGTQLNHLITNKELENFTVVRVDKFVCNKLQEGKNILVLLELSVVQTAEQAGGKIGNPTTCTSMTPEVAVKQEKPSTAANEETSFQPKPTATSVKSEPKPYVSPYAQPSTSSSSGSSMTFDAFSKLHPYMKLYPINSLTPYQNRWAVKARLSKKSGIRTWSNSRTDGRLFSFTLMDQSGSIRATAFNLDVDKYYDMLEVDKVYFVSNAQLKESNKKFDTTGNDYEMSLRGDTIIELCSEDGDSIPMMQLNFTPISELQNLAKDDCVNVIGVCKAQTELQTFVAKTTQKELRKREIQIIDDSKKEISVTLWGDEAERFNGENNPVVAIEAAKISDFGGGVSLGMTMNGSLTINPNIEQAHVLQGWFEREGKDAQCQSLSARTSHGGAGSGKTLTLAEIKKLDLGKSDKAEYVNCVACVVDVIKEHAIYKACPKEGCNKKLVDAYGDMFRCEKCNTDTQEFKWRFMLLLTLGDVTDSLTANCFHDIGEVILGKKAEELAEFMGDKKRFDRKLGESLFREFVFRLRIKMESYNDEVRMRNSIMSATPVDYSELCGVLLKELEA